MRSERVILEADDNGRIEDFPRFPPRARIEATFRILDKAADKAVRTPPPELAAMTTIRGDLVAPAADADDWEALR